MSKWLPFSKTMHLGDTTHSLPPYWGEHNVKIAMANGTSCETAIEEVDLSKCIKKIENKQKFMCLNDIGKLKSSWSEENFIKKSTRTV